MELNTETVRQLRRLIVFTVVAVLLGANWRHLLSLCGYVLSLLQPFLVGCVIAFVLNIPMQAIEKRFGFIRKAGLRRAAGLVCAYLCVIALLVFASLVVLPQIGASLLSLKEKIPPFVQSCIDGLTVFFNQNPEIASAIASLSTDGIDWEGLYESARGFLSQGVEGILSGSFAAAKSIVGFFTSLGIGIFFSLYLLLGKERLKGQAEHLGQALLSEAAYRKLHYVASLARQRFSSFITGQCLEACILGLMFVVTLSLFRLPYAVLIGVLIAFTALIPVFGAFIGLFIGAFLMLIQSPGDAVLFIIIFFVLQQIEGNFIYPHVVGGSVALPPIWVLVAVTLGGSMFGVVGMICFIPLFSVLYELLREKVHAELRRKRLLPEAEPAGSEAEKSKGQPETDRKEGTASLGGKSGKTCGVSKER